MKTMPKSHAVFYYVATIVLIAATFASCLLPYEWALASMGAIAVISMAGLGVTMFKY